MIVTLIKKKFVDEYHWIKEEEMLDLLIFVLCLLLLKKARMNPIWVMLLAGAANVALSLAGLWVENAYVTRQTPTSSGTCSILSSI